MNANQRLPSSHRTYLDFPFDVDWKGRARTTDVQKHVRNLIEQVLFTSPGERVNRPGFGSGLQRLLFSPNSDLLAETTRMTAEAALQQHLGHLIELISVKLSNEESTLVVEINYVLRSEQERQSAAFRLPT